MLKKLSAVVLSLIILFGLTGCTTNTNNTQEEAVSLAILLSNNATFPSMNDSNIESLYDETLNAYMAGSYHEGGRVSVVILDGKPYVPINKSIDVIKTNITQSKRESKAKNLTIGLLRQCVDSPALSEEVDLLQGLNIAAQLVKSGEAKRKKVVVYANGLQTNGILNMLDNDLLNGDIEMLCDELVDKNIIDFSGIEFVWTGMGCVSANAYQQIPNSIISKLEMFWRSIIEKTGGTIEFKDHYISGESEKDLPNVSVVPFAPDKISSSVINKKFGEESIRFIADSAVYFDANSAEKALKPVSAYLEQNKEKRILVVSTTASSGSQKSCVQLSLARANTVKKSLMEIGVNVNSDQIFTKSLGRATSFLRVNDLDENGQLIESLAAKNRAVYIFDLDSPEAKQILNMK